jgi:transcriptional regulator with XRE-family HTH domain
LFAKELASLIGVTEDTILNWEKDRTYPSQKKMLLLKERLGIDPFELTEFPGAISERQKSIINLITERGSITRKECQDLLGLRQQYAQNYLYFLYRLGVLRRTLGKRRRATYFLARDIEY